MNAPANLVITGFMGSGKSAVGRLVAERLGRPFVDMDAVLAQRLGMSVPDVFARLGERFFRREEAALCRELAAQGGMVIATGGGALVDRANREAMAASGTLVCLTASADTLWERLSGTLDRPMLGSADRRARLETLLAVRKPAYDEIPHQVSTDGLALEQVASRVEQIARLADAHRERSLVVRYPGGSYPIFLTHGGLAGLGSYLQSRRLCGPVLVITDSNVGRQWADPARAAIEAAGLSCHLFSFAAGESSKNLQTVQNLIEHMVATGLGRDTTVVALGGGVVGDTAGLVASLYMRGVPFVQVPTSVLAMIDSSVGAKVAVDLPVGKNLVGAFKQPHLVLVDTALVDTLPMAERAAGLAEAVKAGIIADPKLFEMLEGESYELGEVIERSLRVKIEVVEADPFERDRRAVLNLGHTFAHAYEALSHYSLRHGEAVAIGLVLAARLAASRNLCAEDLTSRVRACLARLGLPTEPPAAAPEAVIAAMRTDKKRLSGRLRLVLPLGIGSVRVVDDLSEAELLQFLRENGAAPA